MYNYVLDSSETEELLGLLEPYLRNELVQSMDELPQHGSVSTLEHSLNVTRLALRLDKLIPGSADRKTMAVAGLLHDFYLYDWHGSGWRHSYLHPLRAAENARRCFNVDSRVSRAIESHMWPLGITRPPTSREAVLLCVADKWCALSETLFHRKRKARP